VARAMLVRIGRATFQYTLKEQPAILGDGEDVRDWRGGMLVKQRLGVRVPHCETTHGIVSMTQNAG
jgi:hypothetical protein